MRIGITGHQNLGSEVRVGWVCRELSYAVKKYNVTKGITCLAAGADQIYAEILKGENIPYIVVVPSDSYEKTFGDISSLEKYQILLKKANRIIKLKFNEPNEIAFFEAGKKVVNLSRVIFAIWNGKKAKGLGGTADVVKYALEKNKKVVHFNPISKKVTEI
ncbi:MAG: hypothetical protein H8D56_15495 [Planctomycetes bacterium]|nr:hypothetical protein [Planctomycetota bacterium]MBL7144734.1 hypothetical protein [Phycisphaerae bacterium]